MNPKIWELHFFSSVWCFISSRNLNLVASSFISWNDWIYYVNVLAFFGIIISGLLQSKIPQSTKLCTVLTCKCRRGVITKEKKPRLISLKCYCSFHGFFIYAVNLHINTKANTKTQRSNCRLHSNVFKYSYKSSAKWLLN